MAEKNKYIEELVDKFNADKEDPTITATERVLLSRALEAENQIVEAQKQIVELQNKIQQLRGKSGAFVDSLVALHSVE